MEATQLIARLEKLPWRNGAWGAGAWIDSWATAAQGNLRRPGTDGGLTPGTLEALFGRLLTRVDPWTGMWGNPSPAMGRLQVVNGYYRLTRGSFAQFGVPVPHPERVVDAVLDHARDPRHFGAGRENARTAEGSASRRGRRGPARSRGCWGRRCGWPSSGCRPICWAAPT